MNDPNPSVMGLKPFAKMMLTVELVQLFRTSCQGLWEFALVLSPAVSISVPSVLVAKVDLLLSAPSTPYPHDFLPGDLEHAQSQINLSPSEMTSTSSPLFQVTLTWTIITIRGRPRPPTTRRVKGEPQSKADLPRGDLFE